ncbi:hypothetical protein [Chryseolinea lacunae]|uniref:Histone H1 n=1 Tax=Chryseolinea lacunae TaxID=2801331 RepID=A0ABS1KWG3_9BACT|nr:hypothetical protein [Chryseolinea lacunae]MBL0743804.1 hypothetical protein [Chryseolinea lacunae]
MAKTPSKTPAKTPAKKTSAAAKPKAAPKAAATVAIDKVCEDALKTLKALGIESQLQSDLEWCLGSYSADKNPTGLYEMADRALVVFNAEKAKKTKGVTAKLTGDLEKALKSR